MSPLTPRVNTLFQTNDKITNIDPISKFIIFLELPLGVIRLTILRNVNIIYTVLSMTYSIIFSSFLLYSLYFSLDDSVLNTILIATSTFQLFFYVIFDFIMRKKLKLFYEELNVFDSTVCLNPTIGSGTKKNVLYMILSIVFIFAVYASNAFYFVDDMITFPAQYLPSILIHNIELYFYGHFLSVLVLRVRVINQHMRRSFQPVIGEGLNNTNNKSLYKMEKLMDLYHIIIKAYNYFLEAIQWQLLVTMMSSFVVILCASYRVSLSLIRGSGDLTCLLWFLVQAGVGMLSPLFAPCIFADQVHGEVQSLRELLACRLYDNQLDKASRGIARALLAWTETRDLSFCLLQMVNINTSLPFKFVGLLITYLIILLQFEKVINP